MNTCPMRHRLFSLIALLTLSACQWMPTRPACPSGADISADMLLGHWQVQVAGQAFGDLKLWPHPEHLGSLRGTLTQGTQQHAVVADLDDGAFTMEESPDGQRIAATWQGTPTEGDCGRQMGGQRTPAGQPGQHFLLIRHP
jgi:hypothetical protein